MLKDVKLIWIWWSIWSCAIVWKIWLNYLNVVNGKLVGKACDLKGNELKVSFEKVA